MYEIKININSLKTTKIMILIRFISKDKKFDLAKRLRSFVVLVTKVAYSRDKLML